MNLRNRIVNLEQEHGRVNDEWARVIVKIGETEEAATARWLDEHPVESLPDNIIYRVIT
ncbi:MAG: hypothetical protein ACXWAT_05810 [Methylobacter sp.]